MSADARASARGDAPALAAALAEQGIRCAVEPRAGLALLVASEQQAASLASVDARRAVLALARAHGFTHVAVELGARTALGGAPLLRD
jgi:hypothetical protein